MSLNIDFEFNCYNEDIVIVGMKSSGKTYFANYLLRALKNCNVLVYDMNRQFHDAHAILCHDLTELFSIYDTKKGGHFIFQPFQNDENTFRRYCAEIFKRSNCCALIDEAHFFVSKQKILKEYNDLILSGRPRGISVVSISSRPQNLPNNALTNARHIFAFKLNLESDVKFLESWLGAQAWELLPQNQRKKNNDAPEIPEHAFYYRDTMQPTGVIGKV